MGRPKKPAPNAGTPAAQVAGTVPVDQRPQDHIKVMELLMGPLLQRGATFGEITAALSATGGDATASVQALEGGGFIARNGANIFKAVQNADGSFPWVNSAPPPAPAAPAPVTQGVIAQLPVTAAPPPAQRTSAPPLDVPPWEGLTDPNPILDKLDELLDVQVRTQLVMEEILKALRGGGPQLAVPPPPPATAVPSWPSPTQGIPPPPPPASPPPQPGQFNPGQPPYPAPQPFPPQPPPQAQAQAGFPPQPQPGQFPGQPNNGFPPQPQPGQFPPPPPQPQWTGNPPPNYPPPQQPPQQPNGYPAQPGFPPQNPNGGWGNQPR